MLLKFYTCTQLPYTTPIWFFISPFTLIVAPLMGGLALLARRPIDAGRRFAQFTALSFINVAAGIIMLLCVFSLLSSQCENARARRVRTLAYPPFHVSPPPLPYNVRTLLYYRYLKKSGGKVQATSNQIAGNIILLCVQLLVKYVEVQVCHLYLYAVVTVRKTRKWSSLYWTSDKYDSIEVGRGPSARRSISVSTRGQ